MLPMAYTACAGGILLLLNRVVTYDVKGISREAIEESREYGFVICDDTFLRRIVRHSTVTGNRISSALVHILCLAGLGQISFQIHAVGIGHCSIGPLRYGIWLSEGDAPIQEELETGAHGMSTGFHDDEAPLGDGLQLIRCQTNARSIICRLWLGSFLPLLTEPDSTVRLPRALDRTSAVWLLGAKPPKMVSWQLS